MSDALSSAEIDDQHVELLPDRTVMSMFSITKPTGGTGPDPAPNSSFGRGGELLDIRVGTGLDFGR